MCNHLIYSFVLKIILCTLKNHIPITSSSFYCSVIITHLYALYRL